jgi:hypothetical protein
MTTQEQPPHPPDFCSTFRTPSCRSTRTTAPNKLMHQGGPFSPLQNRFFNQNSALNNERYDSEGGLPFFADEEVDNADKYFEQPLLDSVEGPMAAATSTVLAAPAGVAVVGLTVKMIMLLKAKKLKEELRRGGGLPLGRKASCWRD